MSVRVTWYAPDLRKRDSDGLGPFLKAALDALTKDIGLLPDDHSGFVEESSQRILLDRANPRITLEIKDLEAPVAPAPVAPAPVAPAPVAPRRPKQVATTSASAIVPVKVTRCKGCGEEMQQKPGRGRPRETCSGACRIRVHRHRGRLESNV